MHKAISTPQKQTVALSEWSYSVDCLRCELHNHDRPTCIGFKKAKDVPFQPPEEHLLPVKKKIQAQAVNLWLKLQRFSSNFFTFIRLIWIGYVLIETLFILKTIIFKYLPIAVRVVCELRILGHEPYSWSFIVVCLDLQILRSCWSRNLQWDVCIQRDVYEGVHQNLYNHLCRGNITFVWKRQTR